MKKYLVYLLLPLALAACTDSGDGTIDDTPKDKYADYQITSSIHPIHAAGRVVDGEVETKFQEEDVILIGWNVSGDGTYNGYAYQYKSEMFSPTNNDPAALWTALEKESATTVDVYAWYRKSASESTIPVNNTISVTTDQSTEEAYTSNIYLAAHTTYDKNTISLQFAFSHLMARLKLSIDFNDKGISTSEVQGATVKTKLYTSGTLQEEGSGTNKSLQIGNVQTLAEVSMLVEGDNNYHLDCTCLLPPQILNTDDHVITITLYNGKEYTCTLGKDLTLKAGEEAKVPIGISAGGTSVYDPVVTVVPATQKTSYSGNRLITGNTDQTITIYDKQADGSWGSPAYVYDGKDSNNKLKVGKPYFASVDICGDYAGAGVGSNNGGSSANGDMVYLLQKDKSTGKWYKVEQFSDSGTKASGYSLAINDNFIIYGGSSSSSCNVIPIDKTKGFLTSYKGAVSASTYKLCIADNNVFCNSQTVYQLNLDNQGKPISTLLKDLANGNVYNTRCFTDGKKVIRQLGGGSISIYNLLQGGVSETIESPIQAGSGRPVVIYDKYALAGYETTTLVLYYFDGNKWRRLGESSDNQSFLKILQKYAPSDQINNLKSLYGNNLMMKGTKVSIVSGGGTGDTENPTPTTYFVENIDQIVQQYLADKPLE